MCRNKKLKTIWKDDIDFYMIDFKNNPKGDIICHLSDEDLGAETIEGTIVTPNLKSDAKKVMLISSQQLDRNNPYCYEEFKFYIK